MNRRISKTVSVFTVFALLFIAASNLNANPYYVAVDGDDANNGSETAPFATVLHARDVVRTINSDMSGSIIVYIREGVHFQEQTLELDERDRGSNGYNIIYCSYPGEKATISGGKKITNWTQSGGIYTASTGGKRYRQLFVNDTAAIKAKSGGRGSGNMQEQVFMIHGHWSESYLPENTDGQVPARASRNFLALNFRQSQFATGFRNSPSFVNSPGTFAAEVETIYYAPRAGEDMSKVDAIVPVLDPLINIRGSSVEKLTGNIVFQNLCFAHTTWSGFDSAGFCAVQAGHGFFTEKAASGGYDSVWVDRVPSGVRVEYARHVRFEKCEFKAMGGGGLDFHIACNNCAVTGCTFRDIGGNGIAVAPVASSGDTIKSIIGMFNPTDKRLLCDSVEVSHNSVTGTAYEYKGCVGLFSGYATHLYMAHNKVWNLPYTGISVGWGWSADSNSAMRENIVRANYVQDCMTELIDGGLIYMLSGQPRSIIDSNVLVFTGASQIGGNFFYFDVGCAYLNIRHNATRGPSYTLGMGYGLYDLKIDMNWAEYGNYWTSNGAQQNSDVDKIYVTNMNFGTAPQGLLDNAGPQPDKVQLTPVSARPGREFSRVKTMGNGPQVYNIYNLQGRLLVSIPSKAGLDAAQLIRAKQALPAGTYVITGQAGKNLKTRFISVR